MLIMTPHVTQAVIGKQPVEPVPGIMKFVMGMCQFLMRDLGNVRNVWTLDGFLRERTVNMPLALVASWFIQHRRVIGLDVHQSQITACALIEQPDGTTQIELRQFGPFKRDRRALAEWASDLNPDEVVIESTGIYWKSPYAALEGVGIRAKVVHARHVKNIPGRKTDVGDAEWLAMLARAGLLRAAFVPPAQLRELRLIARQRQNLIRQLTQEKNRPHKILTDSGIRLNVVVSDIHGDSARAMIKSLIAGESAAQALSHASNRLKAPREEIFEALVVRRGYKQAIAAIGHKVLKTIFHMLTRRECYRDSTVGYEAQSVTVKETYLGTSVSLTAKGHVSSEQSWRRIKRSG